MNPEGSRGQGFKDSSERLEKLGFKDSSDLLFLFLLILQKDMEERQPLIILGCFTFLIVRFVNWKPRFY